MHILTQEENGGKMKGKSMNRWLRVMALATFATLVFGFRAQAASPEFSADMVSRSGSQTVNGKIYVGQDKIRTEMPEAIMIVRLDLNVTWMIMPAEKMYMEQPINRQALPKTTKEVGGEVERVSLGKEEVDGKPTEKFKVTYTEGTKRVVMYQWVTEDSGFPIKMEAEDGSWSQEYKNLSLGAQPASLFEPPEGFEKTSMPSGMPSMEEMMKKVGGEK
jgi:hypothetical protein